MTSSYDWRKVTLYNYLTCYTYYSYNTVRIEYNPFMNDDIVIGKILYDELYFYNYFSKFLFTYFLLTKTFHMHSLG